MRIRTTLAIVVAATILAIVALGAMRAPDAISVDQATSWGRVIVRGRIEHFESRWAERPRPPRVCAGWGNTTSYGFAPHGFQVTETTKCTTEDWERIWLVGESARLELEPALAALAAREFPGPREWTPIEKGDCGPPMGWPTDPQLVNAEFKTWVTAECLPVGAGVVIAACRQGDKLVACDGARVWLPEHAPDHVQAAPGAGLLAAIAAIFAALGGIEARGRRRRALLPGGGPYRQPTLPPPPAQSAAPLAILFTAAAAAATAAIFLGVLAR